MTCAEFYELVTKRISTRSFPIPIRMRLRAIGQFEHPDTYGPIDPGVRLEIDTIVPSIETGERNIVVHTTPLNPWIIERMDEREALSYVRSCLHRAVAHELDEWITVDGRERPFDPHREAR